ncbi:transmembrane protein [Holotrichia oblita]|uniref:Transmembrane protein n=1 Tax=Holotrichia oblita TaxID=644536 RepID=A0ACB9TP07_HOLOL|nr:transmembrane protein [Holotrichia oblita]
MVSLSRSLNAQSGAGGATFFSESQNMDDRELLAPILESYGIFKPLNTVSLISLHTVATLALQITAIVYTILHPNEANNCREYFLLVYIQIGLWFLTLIIDQILRIKHYALRLNGYLEFYKRTQVTHRLPFYIVSLWVTFICLIQSIMHHFYAENFTQKCLQGNLLSPIGYMCALITTEFCIVFVVNLCYIIRVVKFNKSKPPPDVQKEEWNACSSIESFAQGEVGYRQRSDRVYDFIEKQVLLLFGFWIWLNMNYRADLIRHLKEHNAKLGEKLMILNAQMISRVRTTNST